MNAGTAAADSERYETLERQTIHALKVHYVWRETVRAILSPGKQALRLESEGACPIHAWLSLGMHPAFRHSPLYDRTLEAHARFHCAVTALYADPSRGDRETTAGAMVLKDCLEDWLTLSRRGSPGP